MSYKMKHERIAIPTTDPDSGYEDDDHGASNTDSNGEYVSQIIQPRPSFPMDEQSTKKTVVGNLAIKTKRIILPTFLITAVVCGIAVVLCFFGVAPQLYGLIVIIALTIITAYMALYGLYRWGEIDDYVDFYKKQNSVFERNCDILEQTRTDISVQVHRMRENVDTLKGETMELNETIESFDALHAALQEIAEDDEAILALIDELNEQYNELKLLSNRKDQAELLLGYYRVYFGGYSKNEFGEEDFKRFLNRLNSKTRRKYTKAGGFKALDVNNDGVVDAEEFMTLTQNIMSDTDGVVAKLIKEQTMRQQAKGAKFDANIDHLYSL